jgi:hypothetical protein
VRNFLGAERGYRRSGVSQSGREAAFNVRDRLGWIDYIETAA